MRVIKARSHKNDIYQYIMIYLHNYNAANGLQLISAPRQSRLVVYAKK